MEEEVFVPSVDEINDLLVAARWSKAQTTNVQARTGAPERPASVGQTTQEAADFPSEDEDRLIRSGFIRPGTGPLRPPVPPKPTSADHPSGLTPYQEWLLNTEKWDAELREKGKA